MHFISLPYLFTVLALVSSSLARIQGISTPATIPAGTTNLNVTLTTADFIQNWVDYFVIFGFALNTSAVSEDPTSVGYPVSSADLITQGHSNTGWGNFTETIPVPTNTTGNYTVVAAVTAAYGASEEVSVQFFTTSVIVQ